MIKFLLGIGLTWMMSMTVFAQTEAQFEANYTKRIKLEILDGIYIPADLNDAYGELSRLSVPAALAQFRQSPEDSIRRKLHFGLGRWILINWGFEEGSRLSHYLKQKGVSVPDDMVEVIIITWHRALNNKPINLGEEIAMIDKRRAAEKARRDEKATRTVIERKPHKE